MSERRDLSPFAAAPVLGIAAGTVALLLLTAARWGYHRDELYFLEASHHMAWGYVDQPPLSVALVWVSRALFGTSLVGVRLPPALADGAAVALTGLIVRELGGERFAQILAALAIAISPFLIAGHLAGPTIYDLAAWALVSWLVIRIIRTGDVRLWPAVGLSVGIALLAKETVLLLLGGLFVGLLVNRQLRLLRSPWLWTGAAIALAIWAPTIGWQIHHGWPTIEMSRNLRREHSGAGYGASFVAIQLLLPGWWVAPVWIAGLVALWREARFRPYRAFAVAYTVLFVLLLVFIGDRPYYLAGLYAVLLAAGSIVACEVVGGTRRFVRRVARGRRLIWRPRRALVFVAVAGVLDLPLALPILPANALRTVPLQDVNYNLGETIGWQELVATVAGVYGSLPPSERSTAVTFTSNYGEAGAIDRYGPALGLPHAFSGHNSYWWWGPPEIDPPGVTIAIGFDDAAYLHQFWNQVTIAAHIHNAPGVQNDEEGAIVWVCRGQRGSWAAIWPELKHYG